MKIILKFFIVGFLLLPTLLTLINWGLVTHTSKDEKTPILIPPSNSPYKLRLNGKTKTIEVFNN